MNQSALLSTISALIFSGMGFMLLLVMVIFERHAFLLLFDLNAVDDVYVTRVFNAIAMVIHVLPYVLGPFILGTFISGFIQLRAQGWPLSLWIVFMSFVLPVFWNITFADTVGVVDTLKNSIGTESIETMRIAAQGVMRQHHVGILGFGAFFVGQLFVLKGLFKSSNV